MIPAPRIAIIADKFPPNWGGGIAASHFQLACMLKQRGFTVKCFGFLDRGSDDSETIRRAAPLRWERFLRRLTHFWFRWREPGKPAYQIADIVARAWGAFRLNEAVAAFAPTVMVVPDHGVPGLFLRPVPGCRRVLVAHHNPARFLTLPVVGAHAAGDVAMALALERRSLGKVDRVVCPSEYMQGEFRTSFPGFNAVTVVPNVVEKSWLDPIPAADPRAGLGLAPDAPLVYIPSGGNKFKGSRFVFEIVRRLAGMAGRPIGFYISGVVPADIRDELAYAPENARLYMPGGLNGADNLAVVKACSFCVSPSLVENYSMALLESVLCGVPVVAFAVGGNPEVLREGKTGFLVPLLDIEAMLARAGALLNDEQRRAMAAHCAEDAAARIGSEVLADAWIAALIEA